MLPPCLRKKLNISHFVSTRLEDQNWRTQEVKVTQVTVVESKGLKTRTYLH